MSIKEQKPEGYNLGALAGRQFERERIIKMIEELNYFAIEKHTLIAMIKGEDA